MNDVDSECSTNYTAITVISDDNGDVIIHIDARKNDEMIKSINEHLGGQGLDLAIYLFIKNL